MDGRNLLDEFIRVERTENRVRIEQLQSEEQRRGGSPARNGPPQIFPFDPEIINDSRQFLPNLHFDRVCLRT
jgi:hypothetical protein